MDRIERLPGLNSGLSPITVHPVTRNNWTTAHHTTTLSIPNRRSMDRINLDEVASDEAVVINLEQLFGNQTEETRDASGRLDERV